MPHSVIQLGSCGITSRLRPISHLDMLVIWNFAVRTPAPGSVSLATQGCHRFHRLNARKSLPNQYPSEHVLVRDVYDRLWPIHTLLRQNHPPQHHRWPGATPLAWLSFRLPAPRTSVAVTRTIDVSLHPRNSCFLGLRRRPGMPPRLHVLEIFPLLVPQAPATFRCSPHHSTISHLSMLFHHVDF